MSDLAIGVLSALLATNQPQAVSNLVQQQTGVSVSVPDGRDPETVALRQLMIDDDAAMDEVNAWINTNAISRTNGAAMTQLNQRIHARLDVVSHGYQQFLLNHPNSAQAYLAYGSFLNDTGDEQGARVQYENSKQLDPKNPAVWNNLANYYGEYGELTNAFADYTEAIRLDPTEPVYYQNFATTVYLYRKDARSYYNINEGQVFDKALGLYRQAMKLAPDNIVLASDYADSFYGIKPMRTNDALAAWTNVLNISKDDNEREGAIVHLARLKIADGFYEQAQAHLDTLTNPAYATIKTRLEHSLAWHKNPTPDTNSISSSDAAADSTNNVAAGTNLVTTALKQLTMETNSPPVVTNPPPLEIAPPSPRGQTTN
jgi:tetratricopeptide (TPR) repeat protein